MSDADTAADLAYADLLPAYQRLDALIARAARPPQTTEAGLADPYRGLYISEAEVEQLLARRPGTPTLPGADNLRPELAAAHAETSTRIARLQCAFGLTDFDVDLVLIALAPELDLRYERLYAYLQDDVTRRKPTLDLALNLLCDTAADKLTRRAHFDPDAPLLRHGLLALAPDPQQFLPPLLAHYLKIDAQIVRFLLAHDGLDPRLAAFCNWIQDEIGSTEPAFNPLLHNTLKTLVISAQATRQSLRLYFHGPQGVGKQFAARLLAQACARPLLCMDLTQALSAAPDLTALLGAFLRMARLQNAIIYLHGMDALFAREQATQHDLLLNALERHPGISIMAGSSLSPQFGRAVRDSLCVAFSPADYAERKACWENRLTQSGIKLEDAELAALAGRFRMTPGQISEAVQAAQNQTRWRHAQQITGMLPTLDDLYGAARAQSGHELATLAQKVGARHDWADLVLAPDQLAQLQEICAQARQRHVVYGEWGFDRKLSLGKGLATLFSGPPGTGKTLAASVIAHELQLDLYKIDLSQVVSKYIGETEKNLNRIFEAAHNANAILFFDEADALFGKRSEVKDAHDRYANLETAYLLQKMEEYEGVAILASNLRQNLDEAFVRRIQIIVEFPFPDEEHRRCIWMQMFPSEAPLDADVDFDLLAREIRLAGGNIKNIALAGAFHAAEEGGAIHLCHLLRAARREYQKIGRSWNEAV